jgi:hypothetical protein
LTTLYHVIAKNTNSWRTRKGDLQRAFPLDVVMVPSSTIAFTTIDKHLTCGRFSLGKTVHLGNFEFIADYFGGMSLSPRRGDEGAAFMGSTHDGVSTPLRTMTEDFLMVSSREGSFDFPSPIGHSTGALLAPATTTT